MDIVLTSTLAAELQARRKRLVTRIQHLPPVGARPLVLADKVAGWAAAGAARVLAELPGVDVRAESVVIDAGAAGLSSQLAAIALALQKEGCLRSWRDEQLDVVGEGECLATMERAAFRPLGLLTRAVHLNGWAPDGRLWIARRSATKSTDPGMWDTLAGGLVASGETLDVALVRESYEEAGMQAAWLAQRTPLRLVSRMHKRLPEGYQVEDALVCDCVLPAQVKPHNLDGEVDEFRLVDLDELRVLLAQDAFTVEAEWVMLDSLLSQAS